MPLALNRRCQLVSLLPVIRQQFHLLPSYKRRGVEVAHGRLKMARLDPLDESVEGLARSA